MNKAPEPVPCLILPISPAERWSDPILEFPGLQFDLPRRQIDQPPLLHPLWWPVGKALLFLDVGFAGDAFNRAAVVLPRCIRNQVDKLRLVGHASIPRDQVKREG